MQIDHLSASQINTFRRCGKQWYYRYVEDLKIPPTGNLVLGSSIHKGLEVNFSQKIESQIDLALGDVLDVYSTEFDARKQEIEEEWDEGQEKDNGVSLLTLYHQNISPTIQPILVEEGFSLQIDGHKVIGYIDLVTAGQIIIDHKTSGRKYAEDVIDKDIQLTAYAMAYHEITGLWPREVGFNVMVKTKTPSIQELRGQRSEADAERFRRIAQDVARAIEADIYIPCDNSITCSWCGYKEICK